MEWTKEKRYRRIDEADESEIQALSKLVETCPWRQKFHIQPITGLLNDPNGFSFYNGEYHLFYQWFPLGPVHGLKYWYHTKSKDLVHWENVGIAIEPKDFFDSHGAYSGSAIENDGKLYLMYTGNTRDENWERHPYQCLAVMGQDGIVSKLENPVISEIPNGYTGHFRDPKVWRTGETFHSVIGGQRMDGTGCTLIYRSYNLMEWEFAGELETSLKDFGYMWECPDYFELQDRGVFIFSPQGLEPQGDKYQNIYQSGYLIGEKWTKENKFLHNSFEELDRGFDFYAPQTMEDPHGRRILVGWMGLPEIDYPTDKHGWAHCLTIPRELIINGDKLLQRPVKELKLLRGEKREIQAILDNELLVPDNFHGETYELIVDFIESNSEEFGIELRVGETEKTTIKYDAKTKKIILDRTKSGEPAGVQYGTVRRCDFDSGSISLRIFVDVSSIEVFVNDGEEVFTARIFPDKNSTGIQFFSYGGRTKIKASKWEI